MARRGTGHPIKAILLAVLLAGSCATGLSRESLSISDSERSGGTELYDYLIRYPSLSDIYLHSYVNALIDREFQDFSDGIAENVLDLLDRAAFYEYLGEYSYTYSRSGNYISFVIFRSIKESESDEIDRNAGAFTIRLKDRRAVSIYDLFRQPSKSLNRIILNINEKLTARYPADRLVPVSASPSAVGNFALQEQGVLFYFEPGTVMPASEGIITVLLNWNELPETALNDL